MTSVDSRAVKRRFYVRCSIAKFGVCNSVRLIIVPVLKSAARKQIVETVIDGKL
jgi:hypothetical protein